MAQLNGDTLLQRLAWRALAHPKAHAFLQKRYGVWKSWCWQEVDDQIRRVASGLCAAGLNGGEAVGVICGSRFEAVVAVLACQSAGLVPVLFNPNLSSGGLAALAQKSGIVALLAEDQEQVDKLADVRTRLPAVRNCWVFDAKGTHSYTHIDVEHFDTLLGSDITLPSISLASAAVGLFSAGVHSEPRFVPVSQSDLMRLQTTGQQLGLREGDRTASLFGLADPIGHFLSVVAPILFGIVPCFGESRLPSVVELRQCAPSVVALPARLLDQLRRETAARAARTGGWRQRIIQRWILSGEPRGWMHVLVGQPVASALGLAACHTVMTGYERMTPVSARFLARLGIATRGLYGLAEAGGPVASFAQAEAPTLRLFEGYGAEITPQGRLLVDVGNQCIDTGDRVDLSGGEIHLVGREVEMLSLPNGDFVSPTVIEAELQASAFVSQAIAIGGPSTGVTAIVELDEVTLRDWARSHNLNFTTLRSLAESTEVSRLIEQAVSEANQRLQPSMHIRRVLLLPRSLDAANGELTPALALRRSVIRNRYAHKLVLGVAV